ncbi:MAG: aminopeptidase [Cyclobacteriaceae bacterium]|nr:aminopeptidase [Cyclobacteriaceae bacterium]
MIKKIIYVFLTLLLLLLIWNWELVVYGVRQGYGQVKIVWNAKPVEYYLNDPAFPDSLKQKLRLIQEVRQYAIDSLGLKDTDNYKTLYDQKGEELMWVVQACEPFALKAKMWDFPILGALPYKGFFNKQKAIEERAILENEGYDVSIRNPGGWSTLGWFTDPILSGMLKREEGDLASLIIHEMVHATIFVKDDADFNENLASFIGDTASYYFLAAKYGKQSKQFTDYLQDDQDYRTYSRHILRGTKSLDSLYQTMNPEEEKEHKLEKKRSMILKIMTSADTLTLSKPRGKLNPDKLPNNTYFISFHLYQSKQDGFKNELEKDFNGDLKKYIQYLSVKYPFL